MSDREEIFKLEGDANFDEQEDDEEEEDDDSSMPELGCEVSIEDLCCDADDEGGNSNAAAAARPEPRRLTLQQRRRLNLYSRPVGLPTGAAASSAGNSGTNSGSNAISVAMDAPWAVHDTPTIHEEDSGVGSVTSPEVQPESAEFPSWRQRGGRIRTMSEPPSPADEDEAAEQAAAHSNEPGNELAAAGASGGAAAGIAGTRRTRTQSTSQAVLSPNSRWPKALLLASRSVYKDPWRDKPVLSAPEEDAVRHLYNPHRREWVQDRVRVRIETEAFDQGAMRQCFRLKKLPRISRVDNWATSACNYVAKKYIEEVDNSVYFEDVRLQMNAKLWAQEYNRHQPPKKVDIMQMSVIEFINRPGAPMYHLEHYIEGEYIKYNSNSGFVDEKLRQTPHALSHFTFERSGHQLIVVDIQGVDDIYTDPQIHTAGGTEFGDGNLGVRGMALFFQSHTCNDICRRMGLSQFDLAPTEVANAPATPTSAETCIRADIFTIGSPPPIASPVSNSVFDSGCSTDEDQQPAGGAATWTPLRRRRNTSGELTPEEELLALSLALNRRQRPSCVQGVLAGGRRQQQKLQQQLSWGRSRSDSGENSDSCSGAGCSSACCLPGLPEVRVVGPILGRVHHELARLHESGRFANSEGAVDWSAALYHEQISAELGVVEAAANLARLHLGMPADCLQDMPRDLLQPSPTSGLAYLESAARLGDRPAMLQLARANDLGHEGLPDKAGQPNWDKAAHYYQQALAMCGQADREGGYDSLDTPSYALKARLAELYLAGGHGLDADPAASVDLYGEAAEDAMAQGNGKLATKYYALAEEAAALVPDDE
ncbi:hypothetical protein BOX15_Mlig021138g1 [Macrostomum lignano]|uniref:Alpha-type protein kinase domain-containing protein n=1 Tax=Macrostomum lignano TaxID=282301 RepID=A0A267EF74_9PLAT|nr:hypothetical protein BOX15_Mlig021138g1 [Macrostomum lignano]